MNSDSLIIILFIALLFVALIVIIIIDIIVCKEDRRYRCYCSMVFKRKANDFGCLGNNEAPECLNCMYYKNYKKHLEEIFK